MPWTKRDVPRFKKGLTDSQKERWVEVANSVLRSCQRRGGSDCEAKAIRQANGTVGNNSNNNEYMEADVLKLYVQSNTGYRIRVTTHQGRRHVVVPVTMMVEGVHSGSHGPLFHPSQELGRYPPSWDGMPIVVNHPEDNRGNPIHANHPDVVDSQVIGRVYNTYMDGNKLKAEAWLDEQATNRMDNRIIPRARAGRRLDVSVGVFTDEEYSSGSYEGENYQRIARNHRPDHLAILPDDVGACSWEDGCGVNLNIKKGGKSVKRTKLQINEVSRTPKFEDVSNEEWNEPTLQDYVSAYNSHNQTETEVNSVEEMPVEMRCWIASLSLLGNANAEKFSDLVYFPVTEPDTLRLNENALKSVINDKGAQANIPEQARRNARRTAYRLLADELDTELQIPDDLSSTMSVNQMKEAVSAVKDFATEPILNELQNNQRGYREIMESLQRQLDNMDDGERAHYLVDLFDDMFVYKVRYSGTTEPAYFKRGYTLNEDNSVSMDGDPVRVSREVEYVELNTNKKEEVTMTKRKKATNTAPQNNQDECCEKVNELINNQSTNFTEEDREWLESLKDEQLDKLAPASGEEAAPQNNQTEEATTEISGEKLAQALKNHVQKPEDFINLAPKELQDSLRSGLNLHREQRKQMIGEIQNNAAEGTFTNEELNDMSTDWLKKIYKSVVRADYSANGGDPNVQNNRGYMKGGPQLNKNTILPPPGVEVEDDISNK